MNKQMRTTWLRRGEWNFLLLASLCALLAASPSAGASLAASSLAVSSLTTASAPQQYKAVLWWLQQHSATGRAPATGFGAPAHQEAQQVAELFARLQDALPVAHHNSIDVPRQSSSTSQSATLSALVSPAAPAVVAPRHDASRRLVARSLTSHEATMLCG